MKMLYGVGVGPGDPELLTVKAVKLLQQAQVVFVPCSKGVSLARQIIAEHVEAGRCLEIPMPMGEDNYARYHQAAQRIDAALVEGAFGVYAVLGDPLLYSTFSYLLPHLSQLGIQVQVVPGISAYQAAAATLNLPLAVKAERVMLVDSDVDDALLSTAETVCIFKPTRCKAHILAMLAQHGFDYHYVKRCTLPEETVLTEKDAILQDDDYLAVLVARKQPI